MPPRLSNPEIRKLKAAAQRMKATFKIGKAGLSPQFLQSVDEGLKHHELIKVKFDEFKEQKKELALSSPRKPPVTSSCKWGTSSCSIARSPKHRRQNEQNLQNEHGTDLPLLILQFCLFPRPQVFCVEIKVAYSTLLVASRLLVGLACGRLDAFRRRGRGLV